MPTEAAAALLAKLRESKRLPSPVGIALRVLELCRRDSTELTEIADVIMTDPALSGRLLKYANSAALGVGEPSNSVRDAVLRLGIRGVKLTALGFSVATPDGAKTCRGFDLQRFWLENFLRAVVARHCVAAQLEVDREQAFTASLLAGIGQLALAIGLGEDYPRVLAEAEQGRPLIEVERDHLGADHLEISALMLADWGLPESLVDAVKHRGSWESAPESAQALARTIELADALLPLFLEQEIPQDTRAHARALIENDLQLDEASWTAMTEGIVQDYAEMTSVFEIALPGPMSVLDLYAEAQEEATRVGMVAQLEQSKAVEANRELLRRATTDALTGIANRAKFDERIRDMIAGVERGHGDFALFLFDIDFFKKFNDQHGHDIGDLVLKRVACAVDNSMREVDFVARYGGEEFVVIAPQADRRGACIIAARLRQCVAQLAIPLHDETLGVTISIGFALTSDYKTPPTAEKLTADADAQMYLSKDHGRNTWSYLGRSAATSEPVLHPQVAAA